MPCTGFHSNFRTSTLFTRGGFGASTRAAIGTGDKTVDWGGINILELRRREVVPGSSSVDCSGTNLGTELESDSGFCTKGSVVNVDFMGDNIVGDFCCTSIF